MFECDTSCPRCGKEFESQDIGDGKCPQCDLPYYQEHDCNEDSCSNWVVWPEFGPDPACYDRVKGECSTLSLHRCAVCCSKNIGDQYEADGRYYQRWYLSIVCRDCGWVGALASYEGPVTIANDQRHHTWQWLKRTWNQTVHKMAYSVAYVEEWGAKPTHVEPAKMHRGHPFYRGEITKEVTT